MELNKLTKKESEQKIVILEAKIEEIIKFLLILQSQLPNVFYSFN